MGGDWRRAVNIPRQSLQALWLTSARPRLEAVVEGSGSFEVSLCFVLFFVIFFLAKGEE